MADSLTPQRLTRAAQVLKCIAHPRRLAIVQLLEKESLPVHRMVERLRLEQAEVSKQLGVLRRGGVVRSQVRGLFRYYSLSLPHVSGVLDCMRKHGAKSL